MLSQSMAFLLLFTIFPSNYVELSFSRTKITWKIKTDNTESHFEMLHEFEIPPEKHKELFITYHPRKITRVGPDIVIFLI